MATTTDYATSGQLGVDLAAVWTPPTAGDYSSGDQPPFALGQQITATDGGVWVFVQLGTGGVTETGYVCVISEAFEAVMLTTSNDTYGDIVGVPACGAAVEDDYIWLQRYGPCPAVQVAANAAANVDLVATATGGQLDDGVTVGEFVKGIVLTTARGGTDGTAPAQLNWPVIDILYEPET